VALPSRLSRRREGHPIAAGRPSGWGGCRLPDSLDTRGAIAWAELVARTESVRSAQPGPAFPDPT